MKRGILYLQMQVNDKAFEDFNRLCELAEKEEAPGLNTTLQELGQTYVPPPNTSLSKAYFYKAKALKKLNN